MEMLRTKEVSSQLGVSQTTIRRWIALLPAAPMRDSLGGYLFTATDMDQFRLIKQQLEDGKTMNDIAIPPAEGAAGQEEQETVYAPQAAEALLAAIAVSGAQEQTAAMAEQTDQLLVRLERVEYSLARKADEVVSFQLLQHRKELEEIRQTVSQLAASLEQLQLPLQMAAAAKENAPLANAKKQRPRRRNIFRLLF